ncbi:MAG: hypothetical protein ACK5KN_14265 [Dysgonomonas sp.]|jgi:hypothetical protein|uniref:hypothetical protein n=1 Tax=unclassified Dysgonomonas TaxID=2630389 RepID=UPI0025B94CFD|nr:MULTISPECIES: hypothetical protein [unclassified Dysgonomonas]MDR2001570.1 hypothetical protein [Prevotella sp.]HMM02828.1 hypothetical protein [Dysgonomonas sp.]
MENNKKALLSVLVVIVMSIGILNGVNKSQNREVNPQQLCVVAEEFHPQMQDLDRGERIFFGVYGAAVGFGIGLICPAAGLAYAL